MSGTVLLECHALVKVFPGVRALDGVGLRLTAGSVHALLGENGAGKSTLIKVLTGVHSPDGGSLTRDGQLVQLRSPLEATRAGIGVVHQERNLIPGFSVAENITLQNPPSHRGLVDREAMTAPAVACLAELGVDLDPQQPVRELSVAQQQLVEIAKALYTESRVLLFDEPTASLSPQETERLFEVIRRLAARGACVVFVSHKLEEVFAVCDTVTVLRDGRSVLESSPLADHTHDDIVGLMVGRAHAATEMRPRTVDRTATPTLVLDKVSTAGGHRDISLEVRPGRSSACTAWSAPGAANWSRRCSALTASRAARSGCTVARSASRHRARPSTSTASAMSPRTARRRASSWSSPSSATSR